MSNNKKKYNDTLMIYIYTLHHKRKSDLKFKNKNIL